MRAFFAAVLFLVVLPAIAAQPEIQGLNRFPPPLESYADQNLTSVSAVLENRIRVQPFNLLASLLFLAAILHTFLATKFRNLAHHIEEDHKARWWAAVQAAEKAGTPPPRETVSVKARLLHFLGEVEAVFGL